MNSALHYLLLYPKWWYYNRTFWWRDFVTRTLSLVESKLQVVDQFQNVRQIPGQVFSKEVTWLQASVVTLRWCAFGAALVVTSLSLAAALVGQPVLPFPTYQKTTLDNDHKAIDQGISISASKQSSTSSQASNSSNLNQ